MRSKKNAIISIVLALVMVFGYLQVLSTWMVGVCAVEPDPDQTEPSVSVEQSTTTETTPSEETTTTTETTPSEETTTTTETTLPQESTTQPTTSTAPEGSATYHVVFLDWDGSVISSTTYNSGDTVVVPADPQRANANGLQYTFSGWGREVALVCEGNAQYVAQYTASQAAKSSDNTLKVLRVHNATISPSFSPSVVNYTANVPYSVVKLQLNVSVNYSKAGVKINNPELVAGGQTKVVITVTAENGSIKTYTITVTRQADPDYMLSSNNNLSGIRVGNAELSPDFKSDVLEYRIWLRYETANVNVIGLTEDSKSTVRTEGGANLTPGVFNEIKVICTAENGLEKMYRVWAYRASADGALPSQPASSQQPATQPSTVPSATEHICPEVSANHVCQSGSDIPVAMVIIPWVLAFAAVISLLVVLLIPKKKR